MNGQKCFELTSETKTGWQTASEDNGPREKYNTERSPGLTTEEQMVRLCSPGIDGAGFLWREESREPS